MKLRSLVSVTLLLAIVLVVLYARYVMLRLLEIVPNPKSYEVDLTLLIFAFGTVTLAMASGIIWLLDRTHVKERDLEQIRGRVTTVESRLEYEHRLNQLSDEVARIREQLKDLPRDR